MANYRISSIICIILAVVFIIGCTAPNGAKTSSAPAIITPAPVIQSFTGSPSSITVGDSSTLSWSVTNATSVSISPGVGTVSGSSVSVKPAGSTTYTLTASGAGGSTNANTSITVKTIATALSYTDPGSGAYRMVKNAAKSSATHLVLDIIGPGGSLSGVGFYLSADQSKVAWTVVDGGDTEKIKNYVFSNALVKSKVVGDILQAGIYQKGVANAINAPSSTVLASVALDLKNTALITIPPSVNLNAVAGKAVILNPPGSGSTTSGISIATGTLIAN
jgi:hypothetical protein